MEDVKSKHIVEHLKVRVTKRLIVSQLNSKWLIVYQVGHKLDQLQLYMLLSPGLFVIITKTWCQQVCNRLCITYFVYKRLQVFCLRSHHQQVVNSLLAYSYVLIMYDLYISTCEFNLFCCGLWGCCYFLQFSQCFCH